MASDRLGWRAATAGKYMRAVERRLATAALVLLVAGTAQPQLVHQCPATLDCGDHCHGVGTPEFRGLTTCPARNRKNGARCEARCDDGYYMEQPWTGQSKLGNQLDNPYTCQCDKHRPLNCSWVPSGGGKGANCEQVMCNASRVAPHATSCPAGSGKCTPTCEPGYEQHGEVKEYSCHHDGKWEGGMVACLEIEDFCPDPHSGLGNIKVKGGGGERCARAMDSVCQFACSGGYERVSGDSLYRCGIDPGHTSADGKPTGTWLAEGDALVCARRCQIPAGGAGPVDNSHFLGGCERKTNTQCTVRCDEGYERDAGTGAYVCSASTYQWKPAGGQPMRCKLTGCPDQSFPGNVTKCESGTIGTRCQPTCNPGFKGTTNAVYTCQKNHTWTRTGDAGHCTPIDDYCPTARNESLHMEIVGDCRGQVDERCRRSCTDGSAAVAFPKTFQQLGGVFYRCQADRSWKADKGVPLVCELKCDGVEPADKHVQIPSNSSSCQRQPRQWCDAECAEHYEAVGGSKEYRCTQSADGRKAEWQDGSLECAPKCEPGYEPIDMNKTGSVLPCAACDFGKFSSDGRQCQPCPGHNDDRSRCYKCPDGYGPNRQKTETKSDRQQRTENSDWWEANTHCEKCSERQLVSKDGVCVAKGESLAQKVLTVVGFVVGLASLALVYIFRRRAKQALRRPAGSEADLLRASFLGGDEKLPAAKLAELDIAPRWAQAEQMHQDRASEGESLAESSASGTMARSVSARKSAATRRRRKGESVSNEVAVMFTNDHVRELQPGNWQQRALGQGTYGLVYKVTWRGQEVAVKVLKLPDLPETSTAAAKAALREQVEKITSDFVAEVEVCCDLNHPNLVRLLGYADRPQLMIMQELLRGSSLDKQLYLERWQPTHDEVLKAAHDVARGMEYLHTMFETAESTHSQPIIHRDLKSPNLMLATRPTEGEDVLVKVTDFGLSRDKALSAVNTNHAATGVMTGCGSVLWWAPEILLGNTYNEKVDVFSFAMCLVELVDCQLPWGREGMLMNGPAEVAMRVTRGDRPHKQLESSVAARLGPLIRDCWHQAPHERPDFAAIVLRLEEMRGIVSSRPPRRSVGGGSAARVSSDAGGARDAAGGALEPLLETDESEALGVTRPGSPDPESPESS